MEGARVTQEAISNADKNDSLGCALLSFLCGDQSVADGVHSGGKQESWHTDTPSDSFALNDQPTDFFTQAEVA